MTPNERKQEQKDRDYCQRENESLHLRVQELEEALEFYADPETYFAIAFFPDSPAGEFIEDFGDDHGHYHFDRPMPGKLARKLLKKD